VSPLTRSRQLLLFAVDPRSLPSEAPAEPEDAHPPAPADPRQVNLFADHAVLARDLDAALRGGRFAEAGRIRGLLEETLGASGWTRDLGFLEALEAAVCAGSPRDTLALWDRIGAGLADRALRSRVREGVYARLFESHSPEALAAARPERLPELVHVLASQPGVSLEEARARGRRLVRDALLAGQSLDSLAFREDAVLSELLAEDLSPRWLACLGVVRRLWPAPTPTPAELAAFRSPAAGAAADEASAFWQCLGVAESASSPEDLLHEARRRMKALQPELHALYMRRALAR
jgi:hypothetical protein